MLRTMKTTEPIKLAFVDDHPALLTGLAAIFAADPRYTVVGTGASADAALTIATSHDPDVMILDLSMPGDVFAAIDKLAHTPRIKLVIFTAFANVELALKALEAGAHAFVLKGRPAEDLYQAIDAVLEGGTFVSPEFSQRLSVGWRTRSRRHATEDKIQLSAREQQLVDGLLAGKTNKEIAQSLQLTEKTVKHYMTNLMNKLRVKNRLEVAMVARKLKQSAAFEFSPEP
jgi:DNA-binding NarL/FixJ family response regulator